LNLTARLANHAYSADFSSFPGKVLFASTTVVVFQPAFFVYEQDSNLYIITRGSTDPADFETDMEFVEEKRDFGTFHGGFLKASEWIWPQIEKYIRDWKGTVYFTGHSYGGAVSSVLYVMAHHFLPVEGDHYQAYAYAPPACMSLASAEKYKKNLFAFANGDDFAPTLSVGNVFKRLKILYPVIGVIPTNWLVDELRGALALAKTTGLIDELYYRAIYEAIPAVVLACKEYEWGIAYDVRYVVGTVYQIDSKIPLRLADCLIDPVEKLNVLSLSVDCIERHHMSEYLKAIDELIWD
jgi:hypothetical protein